MQPGHENTFGTKRSDHPDEPTIHSGQPEATESNENIETIKTPINGTPEERIEAIGEGIRLTEITRNSALADLERWRKNPTNDPSHFEYYLPEIKTRISRAEHSVTSSKLDLDFIKESPVTPEQENNVVRRFISSQVLEGKTVGLKNRLVSFDKKEADFNDRTERNQRATQKLETELVAIDAGIALGGDNVSRLKLNRRGALAEMNGVTDRYESLLKEKTLVDSLASEREAVQSQIREILDNGVEEHEIPKSAQEDPDFAACLKDVEFYSSEDERESRKSNKFDPQAAAVNLFRKRFPKKATYYDRISAGEANPKSVSTEISAEKDSEEFKVVTKEKIISTIKSGIDKRVIKTRPDFEKLKTEPIIDTKYFYDVEPHRAEQSSFEYVDTSKIVGRPNANNYENGWAHEYSERGGRIAEIVDQINRYEDGAGVEEIFHSENNVSERIKLAGYEGPAGPIYTVLDGTHRVAGVKASGLEKMPAEIFRTAYPLEKLSADAKEVADWQGKIDRGFITGSVEVVETENGKRSLLKVQSEILPWIRSQDQNDLFKINQIYNQQYPGAIEQAGFPVETLTDITAFWAYMDGNFDQWKELQKENQPENVPTTEVVVENESVEKRKPKTITTSKGSVYAYLPDGRTQRYKTADGSMEVPQDVLVFIPPFKSIAAEAKKRYPEVFENIDSDAPFEQLLLTYSQTKSHVILPVTADGTTIESLNEIPEDKQVYLAFGVKGVKEGDARKIDFVLPVAKEPSLGWTTFDTRKYTDEKDGVEKRQRHIGNKIVGIDYN